MKLPKILLALILFFLGIVWLNYAVLEPMTKPVQVVSDFMSFEHQLYTWADVKVNEDKLTQEDIQEIFAENRTLKIGGENPNKTFREVIYESKSVAPPIWPGYGLLLLGGLVLVSLFVPSKNKKCSDLSI